MASVIMLTTVSAFAQKTDMQQNLSGSNITDPNCQIDNGQLFCRVVSWVPQLTLPPYFVKPPSKGTGELITGGIIMGLGALKITIGTPLYVIQSNDPQERNSPPPLPTALLIAGGTEMVIGLVILAIGGANRSDYNDWCNKNKCWVRPMVSSNGVGFAF
jgi:hypothetical protein